MAPPMLSFLKQTSISRLDHYATEDRWKAKISPDWFFT